MNHDDSFINRVRRRDSIFNYNGDLETEPQFSVVSSCSLIKNCGLTLVQFENKNQFVDFSLSKFRKKNNYKMNLIKTVAVLLALVVVICSGDPEGLKDVADFEEAMRSRRSIDPLHPAPGLPLGGVSCPWFFCR